MHVPRLEIIDRDEWLISYCRSKTVLHIGCTDWPVTVNKIGSGVLLHSKLCDVAAHVVGLDIDQEGIDHLRALFPKQNFVVHDAENLQSCDAIDFESFDVFIAADVIEHLSNIGLFLTGIGARMDSGNRLVITTPQAFSIKRFISMLLGYEHVHPDHIAYFSLSTLSQILRRHNLEIERAFGFQWKNPTWLNRFANFVCQPILWLTGGRLCDEFALVIRVRLPETI